MTTPGAAQKDEAREAINELGSEKIQLYLDMALEAIAQTLLKDPRFQRFELDPKSSGIRELIAALVAAGLMPPDAKALPDQFEQAVAQVLYPGGEAPEEQLKGIAKRLHDDLSKALDGLDTAPGVADPAKPAR